jgi:phospholipid/cholesterol/gamma-HCH transport system substrate-binding protein
MNIRNDIKLPVDSSVLVTQAGFLGGQYLSITPGGDDKMMAAGSYFENAQGSIDVMGLVGRFATGGSTSNQPPPPKPATGPVRAPDPGGGP